MSDDATVAELLELAAINVERSPGRNVLDAIRDETADVPRAERDAILCDTFYRLLDYLPPHVDSLARWSDAETGDRVAGKLRQLARSIRNGGPRQVDALVLPPTPDELDLVRTAESRNRHTRRPETEWPRDAQLRLERGRVQSALVRMRRAKHPRHHDITEKELRLVEIDRELASMGEQSDGGDADQPEAGTPARRPGATLPVAETPDDHRAVALILESRAFPRERVPVASGSRSGL